MEKVFELLKGQGKNSVEGVIQYLKEAKILDDSTEQLARTTLDGVADPNNLDYAKFLEVLGAIAKEKGLDVKSLTKKAAKAFLGGLGKLLASKSGPSSQPGAPSTVFPEQTPIEVRHESEHSRQVSDHENDLENDHIQSDHDNHESDQDNHDSDHDNHESDRDKHESDHDNHESDHDKHESDHDNHESDHDNHGSDHDNHGSDHDNHGSDHDNHESDHDNHESAHDQQMSDHGHDPSAENRDNSRCRIF